MEYKFRVKRLGKTTPVQVRFSRTDFPMNGNEDRQGATTCVLQISGGIYSGVALLHPHEEDDIWIGMRRSYDRAVDAFVDATQPPQRFKGENIGLRRRAKTAMWRSFMGAYNG